MNICQWDLSSVHYYLPCLIFSLADLIFNATPTNKKEHKPHTHLAKGKSHFQHSQSSVPKLEDLSNSVPTLCSQVCLHLCLLLLTSQNIQHLQRAFLQSYQPERRSLASAQNRMPSTHALSCTCKVGEQGGGGIGQLYSNDECLMINHQLITYVS